MKLNWAERLVVNNPSRVVQQRIEIDWMKSRAPLAPGGAILEIGCGRGAGAKIIREEFKPRVLCAMDLDPAMIRRAVKYIGPNESREIALYAADASFIPHPDNAFDAVFGFGVLHHVPVWQEALSEITRVLKPGGAYFLEELYPSLYQNFITRHILLHPTENRFRSADLRKALEAARLTVSDVLEFKFLGILAVLVKDK